MLRTSESETEILLGNKQLLGIFAVVAALLCVSFVSGFLIGKGGVAKKPASVETASAAPDPSAPPAVAGGETHTLGGEPSSTPAVSDSPASTKDLEAPGPAASSSRAEAAPKSNSPALGTRKKNSPESPAAPVKSRTLDPDSQPTHSGAAYIPQSGSQYLQVVAVGKDEAEMVADVLHRKGFPAHAVPKPGNVKLYRVIVGPVKDAGELASTRDALRRTGFREVIVQHY